MTVLDGESNFLPLCYTGIMQRTYWPTWKKLLLRWGLVAPIFDLMRSTQPLLPLAAQMMFLGMPLFKGFSLGAAYGDLLDMLMDKDALIQFTDYLQESGAVHDVV